MAEFVPVNEPLLAGNEKKYLIECIETGWISSEGPFVEKFEQHMASRIGRRHCVAVTNGSCALDLAVASLQIGPGDEVIVPTFTIISCVQAVARAGATPVLVDCDVQTWNMKTSDVAARITSRTRAIMVVHIYGLTVDMDPILELAAKHNLAVIEDAAEVAGQTYKQRACGSFGDISTFSFYANKHVTCGEGGMIATDDVAIAERCRMGRNLGFGRKRFVHDQLGWNMRMTNLQAAVGLAQLERLDATIARKRRMGARYRQFLTGVPGLQLPPDETPFNQNHYWVYGIVLGDEVPCDAAEAMRRLGENKIGTRPFFWPMHEQPVFRRSGMFEGEAHPNSELIARRGFYLPSGAAVTDAQIDRVAETLKRVVSH